MIQVFNTTIKMYNPIIRTTLDSVKMNIKMLINPIGTIKSCLNGNFEDTFVGGNLYPIHEIHYEPYGRKLSYRSFEITKTSISDYDLLPLYHLYYNGYYLLFEKYNGIVYVSITKYPVENVTDLILNDPITFNNDPKELMNLIDSL